MTIKAVKTMFYFIIGVIIGVYVGVYVGMSHPKFARFIASAFD